MGAPIVRRDELDAELDKLRKEQRKAAAAGRKKAADPDQAFVTRAELRAQFVEFAQMLGIAPAGEPEQLETELDGSGEQLPDAEPVEREAAAADVERDAALFETDGEED